MEERPVNPYDGFCLSEVLRVLQGLEVSWIDLATGSLVEDLKNRAKHLQYKTECLCPLSEDSLLELNQTVQAICELARMRDNKAFNYEVIRQRNRSISLSAFEWIQQQKNLVTAAVSGERTPLILCPRFKSHTISYGIELDIKTFGYPGQCSKTVSFRTQLTEFEEWEQKTKIVIWRPTKYVTDVEINDHVLKINLRKYEARVELSKLRKKTQINLVCRGNLIQVIQVVTRVVEDHRMSLWGLHIGKLIHQEKEYEIRCKLIAVLPIVE